ncbi:Gp37-like protein [Nocardia tengchongensis]
MVATIEFDNVYAAITSREERARARRNQPPLIRIWDGDYVYRGRAENVIEASFSEMDGETGVGKIVLPVDNWLSRWIIDERNRKTENIHITVDRDGARWGGRMESFAVEKTENGPTVVRVLFKHDYEELKHLLIWCNPFLPADLVQFPRLFMMFGPARFALKVTLFLALLRVEGQWWTLPDNPLDVSKWGTLDMRRWRMVVKPHNLLKDASPHAIVHSRFQNFHEVAKSILADGQLTVTLRRHLDGDPPPWPGAALRNGCLVIDVEDKSGWNTGTSFGGTLFAGLAHTKTIIAADGLSENQKPMPDPAFPEEYYRPGWKGTLPVAPAVIYRPRAGIRSSDYSVKPATDGTITAGGHSHEYINSAIDAAVNQAGDAVAMALAVAVPLPPLGGMAQALLNPIYRDTILAWHSWKDPFRTSRLGAFHYHDAFAQGADKAYTLSGVMALRAQHWATRRQVSHTLEVADGAPWLIGQQGHGHFTLGDRVGAVIEGAPPGTVYVDRVSELTLSFGRDQAPSWQITVGQREAKDPVVRAFERIQELTTIANQLGVM